MITGYVLCNNDQAITLRYLLLYGSTYDAAADLLAGERPQEAELMRRSADYVWRALISNYSQAVDRADLPVAVRDRLKWHRENSALDQPERALSFCQKLQQGERSPVPITPFVYHAFALSNYHARDWKSAIDSLQKTSQLRQTGHAYDWFHIAMAYHHLDNADEAQAWFDKASNTVQSNESPHAELFELRDQAQRLLNTRLSAKQP
jgi:tetratricopeptide (TPR) repeat protein